ncbi:MAG: sulfite exporter TauE/SafE family protein [Pikeienuella sp.]
MIGGWELSFADSAIVALIFLFAGMVRGVTGFGLPLVTISLTPFFIAHDLALALNTLVLPLTTLGQIWTVGFHRRGFRLCLPLILGMAATTFVAARFVAHISPAALSLAMGAMLIAVSSWSLSGFSFRIPARAEVSAGFATGLLAGICGAVFTAPGPVVTVYFTGLGFDRREFVATMCLATLISGFLISGAFLANGVLDGPRAAMSAAAAIPALLGMLAGDRLGRGLSVEGFRRLVHVMLFGLGLHYLWKAAS